MRICPKCGGQTPKKTGYCTPCSTAFTRERRREGAYRLSDAARKADRARAYANVYLRRGHLKRGPCEVPGCLEKAMMHHNDFDRPLDVRWRCRTHRIRRGGRGDSPDDRAI